jgi:hypothetical protein
LEFLPKTWEWSGIGFKKFLGNYWEVTRDVSVWLGTNVQNQSFN